MQNAARNSMSELQGQDSAADSAGGPVSLDVLCRRAECLIDSIHKIGEQVNQLFSRPDEALAKANESTKVLNELRARIDARLVDAQQAQELMSRRMAEVQATLATVQDSALGLVQRVQRARELSDAFGKIMDGSAEKIARVESAAHEARRVRDSIANAIADMNRVQTAADTWTQSASSLATRYADLIASGNAAASKLRTLTDAGDRLRESVRQDIVNLRELLRESRIERVAWEQLLARIPAGLPAIAAGSDALAENGADSGRRRSVAVALANRVRKLADYVRQSTGSDRSDADRPPAGNRLAQGAAEDLTRASKL